MANGNTRTDVVVVGEIMGWVAIGAGELGAPVRVGGTLYEDGPPIGPLLQPKVSNASTKLIRIFDVPVMANFLRNPLRVKTRLHPLRRSKRQILPVDIR